MTSRPASADAYQDRLRTQASSETIRASRYVSDFNENPISRVRGATGSGLIARRSAKDTHPPKLLTPARKSEIGAWNDEVVQSRSRERSPLKQQKQQQRERRLSAATMAGQKRARSHSSSQDNEKNHTSSRLPFRAIQDHARFSPTTAVTALNVSANANAADCAGLGKSLKTLAREIEKAEARSRIPVETASPASIREWRSRMSSEQKSSASMPEIEDEFKDGTDAPVDTQSESDESTTPPTSPPSLIRFLDFRNGSECSTNSAPAPVHVSTSTGPLGPSRASSLKSILRCGPLYAQSAPPPPPPGLVHFDPFPVFEGLGRLGFFNDESVSVNVHYADASSDEEEAQPVRSTTPVGPPAAGRTSPLQCFKRQPLQVVKALEPLDNIVVVPHEVHATYWDIKDGEHVSWKCELVFADPDQHACNLRASLSFIACTTFGPTSSSPLFRTTFIEDWDSTKRSRAVLSKYGAHADSVPWDVRRAPDERGRVTAGAWTWKDGMWMRQFAVPIPAALFAACECRAFSVAGSVRYAFDVSAAGLGSAGMNLGGMTLSAQAEVVDVSVLRRARELGAGAVLIESKPDLTGKRLHACAWSRAAA